MYDTLSEGKTNTSKVGVTVDNLSGFDPHPGGSLSKKNTYTMYDGGHILVAISRLQAALNTGERVMLGVHRVF